MGRKPPHPIRSDCSLSQAAFLAYPVQLTRPSNQLTSWSELFPNLGTAARDSEACGGAVQIVRSHFPPVVSLRTIGSSAAEPIGNPGHRRAVSIKSGVTLGADCVVIEPRLRLDARQTGEPSRD